MQRRRIVLVVAIGLLPLLALVAIFESRSVAETEAQIVREHETLARASALVVDVFVRDNVTALEVLARDAAATDDRDPAKLSAHLAAIADRNPNWDGVGLVDGRGLNLTVTPTAALRSVSIADRDYFREALSTGRTAISQAVIGRFSGKPAVALAVPVTLASGDRGVLTGVLSIAFLEERLNAIPGAAETGIIVVDRGGHAIVHPDPAFVARLEDLSALPGVQAALDGRMGSLQRTETGEELLVAYAPITSAGWGAVVRQPTNSAFALVRSDLRQALALTAVGALFMLTLAWLVGGRLQRSYDESETRRRSIERLIEQRAEFLASVGHELKTPLTSISIAAQLIGRRTSENEEVRRYVALMRDQVGRAYALITELLDVSRLESAVPLRRDLVDLTALVRGVTERQRALLPAEPVHEIRVEAADVFVEGDEARLEQVATNLLSNAVKYSPAGGVIDLTLGHDGSRAVLSVIDTGIGMTAEEREVVFAPFARTATARRHGIEGTGLGLYLTRAIVEAHGGRIALASVPGTGTTVVVDLPLAAAPAASPAVAPGLASSAE